ncbi:hypothetical protein CEXT_549061 [Caerostris extrusa]|uniref:Uncharacterized protein n=1 Tax=Caerostris extrusa TaxID=172846 RepID=A0AAV4Y4D1_CAEEX|nr:hypothetical protein CEXT_549061 [Caerostris extrusa]
MFMSSFLMDVRLECPYDTWLQEGETDEPTCRQSNNEAEQPDNRRVEESDHSNSEEYTSTCKMWILNYLKELTNLRRKLFVMNHYVLVD